MDASQERPVAVQEVLLGGSEMGLRTPVSELPVPSAKPSAKPSQSKARSQDICEKSREADRYADQPGIVLIKGRLCSWPSKHPGDKNLVLGITLGHRERKIRFRTSLVTSWDQPHGCSFRMPACSVYP